MTRVGARLTPNPEAQRTYDALYREVYVHLQEPHHGKAFLSALDRAQPDWSARKEELVVKAQAVHWCDAAMRQ